MKSEILALFFAPININFWVHKSKMWSTEHYKREIILPSKSGENNIEILEFK